MKLPYKGGGVALFYKDKHTGEYSILLGKRTIEPGKGKWSIPGGGYEPQDAFYMCYSPEGVLGRNGNLAENCLSRFRS